jgi:hypothetical protein
MIIAIQNFSLKLKSHHFSADWVRKGIGFVTWHIVMDADGNLALVDRLNAPMHWFDHGKVPRNNRMNARE